MDGDDISNNVIHLTNVAIQKTAEGIGFNAIEAMRNVIVLILSIEFNAIEMMKTIMNILINIGFNAIATMGNVMIILF